MKPEQNYRDLYAKSSFSDRLNMTFVFIKENYKEIFKYMLYFALPICLIIAMFSTNLLAPLRNSISSPFFDVSTLASQLNTFLISIATAVFGTAFIYSIYAKKYSEAAKQGLWNDVPTLGKFIVRALVVFLIQFVFVIFLVIPLGFFVLFGGFALGLLSLLIIIPLLIFISPTIAMFTPVYMLENRGLGYSIQKSFKYANSTWGSTFGIYILLSIIASMLGMLGSIPYLVMEILKNIGMFSGDGVNTSVTFLILYNIFQAVSLFFTFLFSLITIVGIMYQYGYAKDKVEHLSEREQIEHFDSL